MSIFRCLRRIFAAASITLFLTVFAASSPAQESSREDSLSAAPAAGADSVSIENLVRAALEANPEIAAMKREFDAARARIPQAKALPDPTVRIGNMNVGSPVPFLRARDGFNENFFIGFSQDLPWFGVRRMRGLTASAEAEAKFEEYKTMVRRLTADVKTAAYELYYIDRALAVIRRDVDILKKFAEVAESRYSVGKALQVDVINARLEIAALLDRQGSLEAKRSIVAANINNLLFRDPLNPIGSLAEFRKSPEPPALEELTRLAMENAPELRRQRRLIDASSHALRLAEREAKYPEVGLGFVYHNRPQGEPDYYTYEISLKLPLYAFKKQRYAIEEQTANLAAGRSRFASTNSLIRYRLREAYVRATTAARLLQLTEEGIVPQATLALESALASYQTGSVDFLTLLTALKRALDYETRYYELLSDYQKALAEMEQFVGIELTK